MRRHTGTLRLPFAQVPAEVSPVASRLHCTTRPLDPHVTRALDQLGAATVGNPTIAMPIAL
jgi:hypothetical protein